MAAPQFITIYDPGTNPIKGLFSARPWNQIPIGSGAYKQLSGVRWGDTDTLSVRPGTVKKTSAAIQASSTPRSFQCLTFQGNAGKLFTSFKSASNITSVYATSDPATFGATITPSTGQYGDTRLPSDGSGHDYQTVYVVVHDPRTDKDCVVIQNGYTTPRVWDGTLMAIHFKVTPPDFASGWGARPIAHQFLAVNDGSKYTAIGGGTGWTFAVNGPTSAGSNYIEFDYSLNTGFGGTGVIALASPLVFGNFSLAKQLILTIVGQGADPTQAIADFQNLFKVTVHGVQSNTTKTLYDPSQATTTGIYGFTAIDGGTMADGSPIMHLAYSLDPMALGTPDISLDDINFVPIAGVTIDDTSSINLVGAVLGGSVAGATTFTVAYYNSGSRAESFQIDLPTKPQRLQDEGMPQSMANIVWPVTDSLFWQFQIDVAMIDQSQANTGVDSLAIYAQATGETQFFYYGIATLAIWTTVWSLSAVNSQTGLFTTSVNLDLSERDLSQVSPGAFQAPIPIGRAMAVGTGSRLIVGTRSDTQDSFSLINLSRSGNPFRFTYAPDLTDDTTAYFDSVNGENAQTFLNYAPSMLGTTLTQLFTDKGLWNVNPVSIGTSYFLTRTGSIGCASPQSVAEAHQIAYFLDTDRQIRQIVGAVSKPISVGTVADKLAVIPIARLLFTNGAWFQNRYFFAYTPVGGTTNTRILVYSERANEQSGAWESDDDLSGMSISCEYLCVQYQNTTTQTGAYGTIAPSILLFIGADGNCYQYQTGTTDLGAAIPFLIQTGVSQQWGKDNQVGSLKRTGILSDPHNGGVVTTTRYYWPKGGTMVNTATLSNANAFEWCYDNNGSSVQATGEGLGVAAYFQMSGSLPGGFQFWGLKIEFEGRQDTPRTTA